MEGRGAISGKGGKLDGSDGAGRSGMWSDAMSKYADRRTSK